METGGNADQDGIQETQTAHGASDQPRVNASFKTECASEYTLDTEHASEPSEGVTCEFIAILAGEYIYVFSLLVNRPLFNIKTTDSPGDLDISTQRLHKID